MPEFNKEQQRAIFHGKGPALILAGPGSGKTTVITQRIRHLILNLCVEPSRILVITFSKAAANEMLNRFQILMKNEYLPVNFGTFHAVFFHILKKHYHYNQSNILKNSEKRAYLEQILTENSFQISTDYESLDNLLQKIAYQKNTTHFVADDFISEEDFKQIYKKYNQLIHENRKIDFEDMLLLCHQLLLENETVREFYQTRYEYILVDEYQDVNKIQNEILKLLTQNNRNLFAVGDDDQAIYGFRGSSPDIMLHFKEDYPEADIISLNINYRCSPGIISFSQSVIRENKSRYTKEFYASALSENNETNFKKDSDEKAVVLLGFESKEAEYEHLLGDFRQLQQTGRLQDSACLFRTNQEASYLAELLTKEKIPFFMKEKPYNPYEHFIFRDIYHYFRITENREEFAQKDFYPIMNKPVRYLKRDAFGTGIGSFQNLYSYYKGTDYMVKIIQRLEYDIKRMEKMDLFSRMNYIRKAMGYDEYLYQFSCEKGTSYEKLVKEAEEIQKRMKLFHSMEELDRHVQEYEGKCQGKEMKEAEGMAVMTFHGAKGLEYEAVYIPDCNEGIIPHNKSSSEKELEEERRMFYVAVTRAKKKLSLYYLGEEKEGRNRNHLKSRFLPEC